MTERGEAKRAQHGLLYRPDIDGLRTVAVIPVILFHVNVAGFSGGYVGVDVFFVISGYLITSIIARELENGSFTFGGFWERRARRILPAAMAVLIASLIAGWFILLPWDYRRLGQEVVAQSGFVSNVFFWMKSGYFDPEAGLRPLLHTWSLSVEEQFYLVFPAILLLLTLLAPRRRVVVLAGAGVISFALAIYWMRTEPSAAFYFLPARAWELLIGVVLALTALKAPAHRGVREAVAWTGIVLIALSVSMYNEGTVFPGSAALLPCVGAVLLIYANAAPNSVARVLSARPVVAIGLLSYSLYLWHWPVLVFFNYLQPHSPSVARATVVIALTGVLAVLSYRFIETPIRKRQWFQSRAALGLALAIPFFSVAAFGYFAHATEGFPARWPEDVRRFAGGVNDTNPRRSDCVGRDAGRILRNDVCTLGSSASVPQRPFVLVWGDSHADAILPAIDRLADNRGITGWQIVNDGCPPLVSDAIWLNHSCRDINRAALTWIEREEPDLVFVIGRWDKFTDKVSSASGEPTPSLLMALEETVRKLKMPPDRIVVFRQPPHHGEDVPRLLVRALTSGADVRSVGKSLGQHRRERHVEARIFAYLETLGVTTVDPATALCNAELCRAAVGAYAAYFDDNHLSARGAMQLTPLIERAVTQRIGGVSIVPERVSLHTPLGEAR